MSSSSSVVRSTALRAGGACVRCRKGKTKCVYENGRAPCKNCAKGMHECYLPSESMSHGGHHVTPVRVPQRSRESLPSERHNGGGGSSDRQGPSASSASRHVSSTSEKYVSTCFILSLPLSASLFFSLLFLVMLHSLDLTALLAFVVRSFPPAVPGGFYAGLLVAGARVSLDAFFSWRLGAVMPQF